MPARNTIFLSFALAWAEVRGAGDIFIGVNALDYSGYPDCRPEYIEAFERMANLATKAGVEGTTHSHPHPADRDDQGRDHPARDWSSASTTRSRDSCYDPDADGTRLRALRLAAVLRRRGFDEAGVADPTAYAPGALEPA